MDPDASPSSGHGAPHKNTRREAREMALRMLFQIDVGGQNTDEVVESSLAQSVLEGPNREFADEVVRGTLANKSTIDSRIQALTEDWALDRQAAVDRNILRMTSYEILYRADTPVAAVINEAVELAKKYSTNESGRFVNGVLGGLARTTPRGADIVVEPETETTEQTEGGEEETPKRTYHIINRPGSRPRGDSE